MAKVIECFCGLIIRAEDEEELVGAAQRHAKETHGMDVSREDALAMARPE